jgi:putative transcriptional regulator
MTIAHHFTDETLQDYAAGVLSSSMETLIACHLTVCPHCRKRAQIADSVAGEVFNQQPAVEVQGSAQDVLSLAANSQDQHNEKHSLELNADIKGVPRPLARLLPAPIDELQWKAFAPGMKQFNLSSQSRKDGSFKLLSLAPGSRMSKHTHSKRELTFIVSGSYQDEIGQYQAGDVADLDASFNHTPQVISDEPCICLIATDAPLKFEGLLGKMVQPFVGI